MELLSLSADLSQVDAQIDLPSPSEAQSRVHDRWKERQEGGSFPVGALDSAKATCLKKKYLDIK